MKAMLKLIATACENKSRRWLTKAYAAGPELEDAMVMCRKFLRQNAAIDVCYWASDEEDPKSVADAYISTIRAVANEAERGIVSIKAMLLKFDPDLIDKIITVAEKSGVGIYFDSRAEEYADRIQSIVMAYAGRNPDVGCAVPGRWSRSPQDAEKLTECGAKIRVVKGQWEDPNNPSIDLREGFMAVVDRLAGRAQHVAVATHDAPLARKALRRLQEAGTPCELELLFGLPLRAPMQVASELGAAVRVYIPYGRSWVPYALRQVVRRPRILWWVMTDSMLGRWSQFVK